MRWGSAGSKPPWVRAVFAKKLGPFRRLTSGRWPLSSAPPGVSSPGEPLARLLRTHRARRCHKGAREFNSHDHLELSVLVGYAVLFFSLSVFGVHRYAMTYLLCKHRYKLQTPLGRFGELPRVTIQLPVFNELYVAERPHRRGLPRSTTRATSSRSRCSTTRPTRPGRIARARVDRLSGRKGSTSSTSTAPNRTGFKAGALENGLKTAQGRVRRRLRRRLRARRRTSCRGPSTTSPIAKVGHGAGALGPPQPRRTRALTQAQAIFLDGHFVIEHTARNRSGRFFNFNGTAGIWRRAGHRRRGRLAARHAHRGPGPVLPRPAQGLAVRLPARRRAPAELPVDMNAFKSQQHRWAKGSIQTRPEAAGPVLQLRPAREGEGRGVLPPHRQPRLPLGGPARHPVAGEHRHPLLARTVRGPPRSTCRSSPSPPSASSPSTS